MWSLTETLVELLRDTDGETVRMSIMVLSFIVFENKMLIASPITLQLAEVLVPLFDHVRLCAPSHSHRVRPGHFVPCGQHPAEPWEADAEVFVSSFHTGQ